MKIAEHTENNGLGIPTVSDGTEHEFSKNTLISTWCPGFKGGELSCLFTTVLPSPNPTFHTALGGVQSRKSSGVSAPPGCLLPSPPRSSGTGEQNSVVCWQMEEFLNKKTCQYFFLFFSFSFRDTQETDTPVSSERALWAVMHFKTLCYTFSRLGLFCCCFSFLI